MGEGGPTPLARRLDASWGPSIPDCPGWERDISLPATLSWPALRPYPDMKVADERRGHSLALLTRMLFSVLVDADRLDTEAFYAKADGNGQMLRGNWQSLTHLCSRRSPRAGAD